MKPALLFLCSLGIAASAFAQFGGPLTSGSSTDRQIQRGVVASDDFIRGSLGANYTNVGTGAAASVTFASGLLSIRASTNGTSSPSDYTYFNNAYIGDSDNYEITVRWKAVGISNNGRPGPGFGILTQEALSLGGSYWVQFCIQPANKGLLTFYNQTAGTPWKATTPTTLPNISANDVMTTKITMRGPVMTTVTWNETNITTSSYMRTGDSLDFSTGQFGYIPGTNGRFAIFHRWSDFDVISWEYRDLNPKNPDVLLIGDSITRGHWAHTASWARELRAAGLSVSMVAGAGAGFADQAAFINEATGFSPTKIVVSLGTNDVSGGQSLATIQANQALLATGLTAFGATKIYWATPGFANGSDRGPLRNWMVANLSNVIDVFPLLGQYSSSGLGTPLSFDGLHPNAAGHRVIGSAILNAITQ